MGLVMGIAERIHVLDFGRKIAEGTPDEVQREPRGDRGVPGRRADRGVTPAGRVLPLLELRDVEARYGEIRALHGITLSVDDGDFVAILGANGAGKTTTLRAISGTVKATGEVIFEGSKIFHRTPEAMARRGVAHVPEGRGTFATLSVLDNLRLGAWTQRGDVAAGSRARVRVLPAALRTARAAGRHALGRRAADARTRPRDDGEAAAAAARRAVARARSGRGARDLRHAAADEREAARRSSSSSRTRRSRSTRPSTCSCSRPGASCTAARRPSLRADESVRKAYLGY